MKEKAAMIKTAAIPIQTFITFLAEVFMDDGFWAPNEVVVKCFGMGKSSKV